MYSFRRNKKGLLFSWFMSAGEVRDSFVCQAHSRSGVRRGLSLGLCEIMAPVKPNTQLWGRKRFVFTQDALHLKSKVISNGTSAGRRWSSPFRAIGLGPLGKMMPGFSSTAFTDICKQILISEDGGSSKLHQSVQPGMRGRKTQAGMRKAMDLHEVAEWDWRKPLHLCPPHFSHR